MFDEKRIEKGLYWDRAWSCIEGCTPVSEGCRHCWAAQQTYVRSYQKNPKIKARYKGLNKDKTTFNGKIRLMDNNLDLPLRIRKPTVWAVWNDLFHKDVPFDFIERVWATMMEANHHVYIILTKRPERMLEAAKYFCWTAVPHIWFGVSVEDQPSADKRIPYLLKIDAAVRIVSYEPALGALDIRKATHCGLAERQRMLGLTYAEATRFPDWIICGGETGPGARPMNPDWARQVRDQCVAAGIPFFFKQWGRWAPCHYHDIGYWLTEYEPGTDGIFLGRHYEKVQYFHRQTFAPVGKKQAGRLLDGKIWDQVPER